MLATRHPRRGVDAVPVCFAVADRTVVVPVDRVKPKGSTDLQGEEPRRRPAGRPALRPLGRARLDATVVGAGVTGTGDATEGERSTLAALLRAKYPPTSERLCRA